MLDITPSQGFPHMYDFIGKTAAKGANPLVLVIITAVIMLYYLLFRYLRTLILRLNGCKTKGLSFVLSAFNSA